MMQVAVIGAGFGDEGKGKVVSHLCSILPNPLVVRFSGGHQAGHRVVANGVDHVFSNFGSGTLHGVPTYWSEFCTVDPVGLFNEYSVLLRKGISPRIYLNDKCPVTTPFDKAANLILAAGSGHGTCGVGVGQTYQREQDGYSLLVCDLFNPWVLKIRMGLIEGYYRRLVPDIVTQELLDKFLAGCWFLTHADFIRRSTGLGDCGDRPVVFEGSQGLLLDQNIGFFPYVTRANTGLTNILSMGHDPDVWLVTRAYQTRHGPGPMSNDGLTIEVRAQNDHNRDDGHQGRFRTAPLDLSLIKYAVERSGCRPTALVITCLDLLREYKLTIDSALHQYQSEDEFLEVIISYLGIDNLLISQEPGIELDYTLTSSRFM